MQPDKVNESLMALITEKTKELLRYLVGAKIRVFKYYMNKFQIYHVLEGSQLITDGLHFGNLTGAVLNTKP